MSMSRFVLGMVLAVYVGFSRLHHLRFLAREPMLTGILQVGRLPPQCTFWRFLASLHLGVARQLLEVQRRMRERVWEAAHVQLAAVTLDTDTTVHTLFGHQMGGRKSYNPKNKGKKSYQPILTFLAETREYVGGELRNGDRPTGAQIARHLQQVLAALPPTVNTIYARADSGFYCGEAVEAYESRGVQFIVSARKRRVWWRNCGRPTGSPPRAPTPTGNASFAINRRAGEKRIGSSPCATARSRDRTRLASRSNTNCSTRRSTPIASSSPT
jgi:hypothetical protein